jgi:hypothetical protein
MARQVVNGDELCELINRELARFGACRGCAIAGVRRLPEARGDGCNWDTHVLVAAHRIGGGACLPHFGRTVRHFQALYNLA